MKMLCRLRMNRGSHNNKVVVEWTAGFDLPPHICPGSDTAGRGC